MFSSKSALAVGLTALQLSAMAVDAAPFGQSKAAQLRERRFAANNARQDKRAGSWSVYAYDNSGFKEYYVESRSTTECEITMSNLLEIAYDDAINMIPANKEQILGCRDLPGRSSGAPEILLLSLPTSQCSCVASPTNNVSLHSKQCVPKSWTSLCPTGTMCLTVTTKTISCKSGNSMMPPPPTKPLVV